MSRAAAEVGSTANSYQILAKLAVGGMAEIFLARGEGVAGVERYCVLKRILPDRASDIHFVQMFLDEARLAAQLQHANVAQVYDIGKLGDSYFFTMEYVHGETVRTLLHRALGLRRALPISCVLTIAAGTAAGLHHAHTRLGRDGRALGIVHRDVSPSNLMVSYDGGVKLVDFGVAKASDRSQETKSGTVKGKISYLSPEQCRGKRVDRRSDLFSLGICFWEMLTTERLYKRSTDFENMNAIVTEPPPPPSSRRPEVPRELDELVLRLLAKTPEERFETADEVVEAIETLAGRTGAMVSTPALGRFMRELFGQRPEPWLELDSQQELGEAVTVTSEPIPSDLAIQAAKHVNHQLAGVVDLSPPRQVTESLQPMAIDPMTSAVMASAPMTSVAIARPGAGRPAAGMSAVGPMATAPTSEPAPAEPTAQLSRRRSLGFPLAAPPPTDPGILALANRDEPGAGSPLPPPPPVRPAGTAKLAVPRPPPDRSEDTQSLPSIEIETASASGELPAAPGGLWAAPSRPRAASSGLRAAVSETFEAPTAVEPGPSRKTGPQRVPGGPRSGPVPVPPGPRSGPVPVPAGPRSGPMTVPAGPRSVPMTVPAGPRSGPVPVPAGPRSGSLVAPLEALASPSAAQAALSAASSGAFAASAVPARPSVRDHALRTSEAIAIVSPRRPTWPLYAVIGFATLVGAIAIMLLMRSGPAPAANVVAANGDAPASASDEPHKQDEPPHKQPGMTVDPIEPPIDPAPRAVTSPPAANPAPPAAPTTAAAGAARTAEHPELAAPAPPARSAEPSASAAPAPPARSAEPPASAAAAPPARSAEPPASAAAAPPVRFATVPHAGGAGSTMSVHGEPSTPATPPSTARPRTAPASSITKPTTPPSAAKLAASSPSSAKPAPSSAAKPAPDEDVAEAYAAGRYDQVVQQCDGLVSAEHAPFCFLAACHLGSEAKARKLIVAVAPGKRDQLITNCRQFGVDIAPRKKPAAGDCDADPMACQH
ncbi:MAG TPA: protein kinase [Kofleriaceae bacterium]|nr:protein kinase [Kofleriaceae bacterium]